LVASGFLTIFGVVVGAALLFLLLYKGLGDGFLTTISTNEAARSLITFLFAVTTVGIAIIVVLGAFLTSGDKDMITLRFQQGKDVLSLLLGVFGTIVGFYFGSSNLSSEQQQRQQGTEQQQRGAERRTQPGALGSPALSTPGQAREQPQRSEDVPPAAPESAPPAVQPPASGGGAGSPTR
jgi:membrane protease YdiL (CAAX protease family)